MPMSIEEFMKLPEKTRHDFLRDATIEKMKGEGFVKIQKEKELGHNRERRIDLYAEKNGKRIGVEIWTDRSLYEKIADYEGFLGEFIDEIVLVIPGKTVKLWCLEVPSEYLK